MLLPVRRQEVFPPIARPRGNPLQHGSPRGGSKAPVVRPSALWLRVAPVKLAHPPGRVMRLRSGRPWGPPFACGLFGCVMHPRGHPLTGSRCAKRAPPYGGCVMHPGGCPLTRAPARRQGPRGAQRLGLCCYSAASGSGSSSPMAATRSAFTASSSARRSVSAALGPSGMVP